LPYSCSIHQNALFVYSHQYTILLTTDIVCSVLGLMKTCSFFECPVAICFDSGLNLKYFLHSAKFRGPTHNSLWPQFFFFFGRGPHRSSRCRQPCGLRHGSAWLGCRFESHRGAWTSLGECCVSSAASESGRSLVQRSPTDCVCH